MKPDVVVGGDAKLFRRRGIAIPAGSIEVPCQQCGRMTLIAPDGQRVALGEREPLVSLKVEDDGAIGFEPAGVNESSVPVVCMWCAFADEPKILAALGPKL